MTGYYHPLPMMLAPHYNDMIAEEVNVKNVEVVVKEFKFTKDEYVYLARIKFGNKDFAPGQLIYDGYKVLCNDEFFKKRVEEAIESAQQIGTIYDEQA